MNAEPGANKAMTEDEVSEAKIRELRQAIDAAMQQGGESVEEEAPKTTWWQRNMFTVIAVLAVIRLAWHWVHR